MTFQWQPPDHHPTLIQNISLRGATSASERYKGPNLHSPPSPTSHPMPCWSLDTSEPDEDEEDDLSFMGSESEESSGDRECEELSDEGCRQLKDDGDKIGEDNSEELSDEDETESSDNGDDDDDDEVDDEIPDDEVAALLLEAKMPPVRRLVAAGTGNEGSIRTAEVNTTQKDKFSGKGDKSTATLESTAKGKSPLFPFANASPIASPASRSTPKEEPTLNFNALRDEDDNEDSLNRPKFTLLSSSNRLLLREVFRIQETDRENHLCRSLDAQGAPCKSSVSRIHSLGIKRIESSFGISDEIQDKDIQSLAMYSMCGAHIMHSSTLAQEWARLTKLTEPTRKYWQNKQVFGISRPLWEKYNESAATEIRKIISNQEETMQPLDNNSVQFNTTTTTQVQSFINSFDATNCIEKIFSLEETIKNLTAENASLKDAQKLTEDALAIHRECNQQEFSDAIKRYKMSEKSVEQLRKDNTTLNFKIDGLRIENVSLGEALKTAENALAERRERDQQDFSHTEELYSISQNTVMQLRKDNDALTLMIDILTADSASLREARKIAEDAHAKERKDNQSDLSNAKKLYNMSQETVEQLRKDNSAWASKINELTAENSSLKEAQNSTKDALVQENKRSQHKQDLYEGSERSVEALRSEFDGLKSLISELTASESTLTNLLESAQDALNKEQNARKVDRKETLDRLESSQRTIEALHKEVDVLNSRIGKLETQESALKISLKITQDLLKNKHEDLIYTKGVCESSQKTVEELHKEVDVLNSHINELAANLEALFFSSKRTLIRCEESISNFKSRMPNFKTR